MKLIKAIKLHRKLRINQEIYFYKVIEWSQKSYLYNLPFAASVERYYKESPDLNMLGSYNRAVKKVESKLPNLYFILSDLFGGAESIKKEVDKQFPNLIK